MADADGYHYPPDPYWVIDTRGPREKWHYVDYDGERLIVSRDEADDLWIDKQGEGPVYIRKEDIPVIIAAINKDYQSSD